MPSCTPAALAASLQSPGSTGEALFDVRETGEAHRGHVPGATFLPRRQIEVRIESLVPRRDTVITVYDSGEDGDSRARRASRTLARLGWSGVRVLEGGLAAWRAAGNRVAQGSNVPSKHFGEVLHTADRVPGISAGELKRWQDEGRPHVVCDIRSPEEFVRKRIPGAVGAFGVDLALLADDLRERGVPIVVHCSGRTRSIVACRSLQLLGVPSAVALENGTMGWHLEGYALASGDGEVLQPHVQVGSGESAMSIAQTVGARMVNSATFAEWLNARTAGRANVYPIDVRQVDAYRTGHIPGAVAVPGGLAIQRADEFVPVRSGRVVFIDDGEARAALTAYWYCRMDFPEVYILAGGLDGWKTEGRPLDTGRGRSEPAGWSDAQARVEEIDPVMANEMAIKGAAHFVWVDTSAQYAHGRPAGAQWIPYGKLEDRVATMDSATRQRLILCCRDGMLGVLAGANLARDSGGRVRVLRGGAKAWMAHNLPIESGRLAGADDLIVQPYDCGEAAMRRYLEWETTLTAEAAAARKTLHPD